jgi:hypothetical protein
MSQRIEVAQLRCPHKSHFRRFCGKNEVACGDGRYACASPKIFLSRDSGGSIGPAMIKDALSKARLIQVEELLLTQPVRLLSP